MGCFSVSCAISGLPIDGGDRVRVCLLNKNRYERGAAACSIDGIWSPRTWPVVGVYDDSGGAEIDESAITETWRRGLAYDAVDPSVTRLSASALVALARDGGLLVRPSSDPLPLEVLRPERPNPGAMPAGLREMASAIDASRAEEAKGPPVTVAPMLVRDDVWRALCATPIPSWDGDEAIGRSPFREAAGAAWGRLLAWDGRPLGPHDLPRGYGSAFLASEPTGVLGLDVSFALVARAHLDGKVSAAEAEAFLDSAADFGFLRYLLGGVRHTWRPSYAAGPQSGEWSAHERFLCALLGVAKARADEQRARWAGDES